MLKYKGENTMRYTTENLYPTTNYVIRKRKRAQKERRRKLAIQRILALIGIIASIICAFMGDASLLIFFVPLCFLLLISKRVVLEI